MGVFDGLFDQGGSGDPEIDELLADLQKLQTAAAQSAQQMAIATADGFSRDELAHVWVNAQGVVIQAEFDDRLFPRATQAEVAEAVVEAAQAAAAKIQAKTEALQAGLWQQVASMGSSEMRPDMQAFTELTQNPEFRPEVPLSPPDSRERRAAAEALAAAAADDGDEDDPQEWRFTISDKD